MGFSYFSCGAFMTSWFCLKIKGILVRMIFNPGKENAKLFPRFIV